MTMSASSFGKRSRQNLAPETELADANNTEQAGLPFQQNSIHDYRASREAEDATTGSSQSEYFDATSGATSTMTPKILDRTSSPGLSSRFLNKRSIFAVDSDDGDTAPVTGAKSIDYPRKKKGS
jgi:hypothetical protein